MALFRKGPIFKKLEKYQRQAEGGERFLVNEILALENRVHAMQDSEQKRLLEIELAALNARLSRVAQQAEREHLAEARKLKQMKQKGQI